MTIVKLQRKGERVQISVELNFQSGTSMMEYEEQILQALNEAGRQATGQCLEQFDADGSPIVIGGLKLTSKGPVLKSYQTPFGETAVERHVYQSSEGGPTFCPLDQQARIVNSSTPRFAKMCAFKYATMNSTLAQRDLLESHGRICVVHLRRPIGDDGVEKQRNQRRALLRWAMRHLASDPKANLVIMGDFNEGHPVGSDGQALGVLFQARPPLMDSLSIL